MTSFLSNYPKYLDQKKISLLVKGTLDEDLKDGNGNYLDLSSDALENKWLKAQIISRQFAIVCGVDFVNQVFQQVDPSVKLNWQVKEGEQILANQIILNLEAKVKSLLKAERSALNFLQTLSGIATKTYKYKQLIQGSKTQILDTRKTIPNLRAAQKYATFIGGAKNHRFGLFDAILLKENHILAAGGIEVAVKQIKKIHPDLFCEVEVENLKQLKTALKLAKEKKIDRILLDNFSIEQIKQAVLINQGICPLEASGEINSDNIKSVAQSGVDYISLGDLTKNIEAINLSLRILE